MLPEAPRALREHRVSTIDGLMMEHRGEHGQGTYGVTGRQYDESSQRHTFHVCFCATQQPPSIVSYYVVPGTSIRT